MAWQRGRGRGRGRGTLAEVVRADSGPSLKEAAQRRFQEARARQQAAIQRHVTLEYESSEEEDEDDAESANILGSVLRSYSQLGGAGGDLGRTQKFLEDLFVSGAATCLICIASVKRTDPIWNCEGCHTFFHLTCIQRWSKDSVAHQKMSAEDPAPRGKPQPVFNWACPKCRREYGEGQSPRSYLCFCGQAVDPPHHPWLLPHSCGETCGRPLQPECGHKCLLLCHPGPCPPCPKMVPASCHCGKSAVRQRRCSRRDWGCGAECGRTLQCGLHQCSQACHPGECQPCGRTSRQACHCGALEALRPCASPRFSCDKVCGKGLDCGRHSCQQVCHGGECGGCPRAGPRTCPCGKTTHRLPCTVEAVPLCGDTCGRALACGRHSCPRPCHRDSCGACLEVVERRCRCGLHSKELPCQKEHLCDTKCKKIKDCGRHPCNRKCCDGACPPCEKECVRTLRCGQHKCAGACHRGPCYPCPLTAAVSCPCGQTSVTVPCGRQRRTRPPRCSQPCRLAPDCHHERREPHRCHPGDCPPCRQVCSKPLPGCAHRCPAPCHSAVLVRVEDGHRPAGPWEVTPPQLELRSLPCPPCIVPVPVTCPGGHETCDQSCSSAEPRPCGRVCGRLLPCGNHACSRPCHAVSAATGGDPSKSGPECEDCEEVCSRARPEGCGHSCPLPCHPGSCPPCGHMVRLACHCGLAQPWVRCGDWTAAGEDERRALRCCGNQCPRNFECGHRCREKCHPGDCPGPELCRRKVKVHCQCRRLRREFPCDQVRAGVASVPCDEVCHARKQERLQAQEEEDRRRKREEELRDQQELERFNRKFQQHQKKRKERAGPGDDSGRSSLLRSAPAYALAVLAALALSVYLAWPP